MAISALDHAPHCRAPQSMSTNRSICSRVSQSIRQMLCKLLARSQASLVLVHMQQCMSGVSSCTVLRLQQYPAQSCTPRQMLSNGFPPCPACLVHTLAALLWTSKVTILLQRSCVLCCLLTCCGMLPTWRQRHLEGAAEDARVQGDDALREQDLLLALQADRDEGAHEVVVVNVRRDAVACVQKLEHQMNYQFSRQCQPRACSGPACC